jgi:hypothetical protein
LSDEDIRELLASGAWSEKDLEDDMAGSSTPEVTLDLSLSAELVDGRRVAASGEMLIGTGIAESDATTATLQEILEATVFRFSRLSERWEQLRDALAARGVHVKPDELDTVEREIVIDRGHLAPPGAIS